MKKPTVDYRGFRLSRIREPQFSHLSLLLGWVVYFFLFFLTEAPIPAERCHPVHCFLDDLIPFQELFLIPYVLWYFLIIFSLVYFLLYNVSAFRRLQTCLILIQGAAIIIYVLFPTRQDLRPTVFPRENFLTQSVAFLYSIDTNTGVCPSMHAAFSIAIASAWLKAREVSRFWKGTVAVTAALICLSTMFIKQHSALDFLAALPLCLAAEWIVNGRESGRSVFPFRRFSPSE